PGRKGQSVVLIALATLLAILLVALLALLPVLLFALFALIAVLGVALVEVLQLPHNGGEWVLGDGHRQFLPSWREDLLLPVLPFEGERVRDDWCRRFLHTGKDRPGLPVGDKRILDPRSGLSWVLAGLLRLSRLINETEPQAKRQKRCDT